MILNAVAPHSCPVDELIDKVVDAPPIVRVPPDVLIVEGVPDIVIPLFDVSPVHDIAPVFIEPDDEFIMTFALALPILIGFVVILPIFIVAPALTDPLSNVAPILIVGVDKVFPVPILISPSLLTCAPKSKSAPPSVCKSPILTLRFAEFVELLIELAITLKSPTVIAVVAVGPIFII